MKLHSLIILFSITAITVGFMGCHESQKAPSGVDQDPATEPTDTEPADTKPGFQRVTESLPNGIAARVDGIDVSEQQLSEEMKTMLTQLDRDYTGKEKDGEYFHSIRVIRGRAVERLITLALVDREMKKHHVVITDEQINQHIKESAVENGMTLDNLKDLVTSRNRQSYEEWKRQAQYDKRLGLDQLIELEYSEQLNVSEDQARRFYQTHYNMFEVPEKVRASHILIKYESSNPYDDPVEFDAKARVKAEDLLKQIKNGADFAELAKAYSECPSREKGGDLGYANRRNWVPEFSQAAFDLHPGQVSDVIKTRFGYHIVKVTDRTEPSVISFKEARDGIMDKITFNKKDRLKVKYLEQLRSQARVEYAPGNMITMVPLLTL